MTLHLDIYDTFECQCEKEYNGMKQMTQNIKLLAFFLIFAGQVLSQEYSFGSKISPENLKTDFTILLTSLRDNHPGLYDFTSKTQFDSLAEQNFHALNDSITEEEFHLLIRKFIRVIGCGHTSARPSNDWYQSMRKNPSAIPIHILLQNDEIYIRKVFIEGEDALVGSRIMSIDGIPATEILTELKSITGRDGIGETMVDRNIERIFQTYMTFLYGVKESYLVKLINGNGQIMEVSLSGTLPKRYQKDKTIELTETTEVSNAKFGILPESKNIAVLDMSSFPRKKYKKFYRQVFKRLKTMDSVDLILDLRGNGGGFFPNGNHLLRYLMNEKFTMDFSKPKGRSKKNDHMKLDFSSNMTRGIFATIPDRNKKDPDRNYQIRYKLKKRNHFAGQIYVITDGWTFSTGSFVASKLKPSDNVTIVGEESGGGEVGFNAVLMWELTLPNSGLHITLPIYHVDIQPKEIDAGRGVLPDISIQYDDLQLRIDQIDLELMRIIQLCEEK